MYLLSARVINKKYCKHCYILFFSGGEEGGEGGEGGVHLIFIWSAKCPASQIISTNVLPTTYVELYFIALNLNIYNK